MRYERARRRLHAASQRLKRASETRAPLARLRLLQKVEDAANIVASEIRSEIARLAGEVIR